MKVLIAYDGSAPSDAAMDDLVRAGLPQAGEARVISVAEVWLPPKDGIDEASGSRYIDEIIARHRAKSEEYLGETRLLAERGRQRAVNALPAWDISPVGTWGSPAWEILSEAEAFSADLIVLGSVGHSAIGRILLGSVSQKVLTEAHCSVRVARGKIELDNGPLRIVIAFDLSKGADRAVKAVAARNWPEGTNVKLVSVADAASPSFIGAVIPSVREAVTELNQAEGELLERAGSAALDTLKSAGLDGSLEIVEGNPKHKIVEAAEKWGADSIFLGANAFGSRLERFLIGSTSAAVSERAHCSVEVVRGPDAGDEAS